MGGPLRKPYFKGVGEGWVGRVLYTPPFSRQTTWKFKVNYKKGRKSAEAYAAPSQTSKMELFAEIVNGLQQLTDFTKSSILDVWLSSECASEPNVEKTVILNEWVSKYFANVETSLFAETKLKSANYLFFSILSFQELPLHQPKLYFKVHS